MEQILNYTTENKRNQQMKLVNSLSQYSENPAENVTVKGHKFQVDICFVRER